MHTSELAAASEKEALSTHMSEDEDEGDFEKATDAPRSIGQRCCQCWCYCCIATIIVLTILVSAVNWLVPDPLDPAQEAAEAILSLAAGSVHGLSPLNRICSLRENRSMEGMGKYAPFLSPANPLYTDLDSESARTTVRRLTTQLQELVPTVDCHRRGGLTPVQAQCCANGLSYRQAPDKVNMACTLLRLRAPDGFQYDLSNFTAVYDALVPMIGVNGVMDAVAALGYPLVYPAIHFCGMWGAENAARRGIDLGRVLEVFSTWHIPYENSFVHGATWQVLLRSIDESPRAMWASLCAISRVCDPDSIHSVQYLYDVPHGVGHGAIMAAALRSRGLTYKPRHVTSMLTFPTSRDLQVGLGEKEIENALAWCEAAPMRSFGFICADGVYHAWSHIVAGVIDFTRASESCARGLARLFRAVCFRFLVTNTLTTEKLRHAPPLSLARCQYAAARYGGGGEAAVRACIMSASQAFFSPNLIFEKLLAEAAPQWSHCSKVRVSIGVELFTAFSEFISDVVQSVQEYGALPSISLFCTAFVPPSERPLSTFQFGCLKACIHGALFHQTAHDVDGRGVPLESVQSFCRAAFPPSPLDPLARAKSTSGIIPTMPAAQRFGVWALSGVESEELQRLCVRSLAQVLPGQGQRIQVKEFDYYEDNLY